MIDFQVNRNIRIQKTGFGIYEFSVMQVILGPRILRPASDLPSEPIQSLIYVGDYIFDIFYSDRYAHQPVRDSQPVALKLRDRGVRHRRRVRNQSLYAAKRFAQRAEPNAFEHFRRIFERAGLE